MKNIKRVVSFVCIFTMLFSGISMISPKVDIVHGAIAEKLLSGNTIGSSIFPTGTAVINTGATYSWLTQGKYATDPGIVTTDNQGIADMFDGISGTDGNYSNNTNWGQGAKYGNLTYDIKAVYQISTVKVWADCDNNSYMNKVEVFASIDGINYNSVEAVDNPNAVGSGFNAVTIKVSPIVYARYVKVIMYKDTAKNIMRLGEVAVYGDSAGAQAILSSNYLRTSGTYNTTCPKISTDATYSWVTEQPFVTENDLIVNDTNGTGDGVGGLPDLTDGSDTQTAGDMTTNTAWGAQGKYGVVVFNLNDTYQIGQIDVWSRADSSKFMDGYEVLVSTDNKNYSSLGYTANSNSRTANAIVNTVAYGVPGKAAKYVKIIMHNANDSQQLTLGEIAIWGWKLYDTTLAVNATPEPIEFRAALKNYSTLYLDWSNYNHIVNDVNKYSVYVETTNFTSTVGKTSKATYQAGTTQQVAKSSVIFALNPQTTYYVAITPYKTTGAENTAVSTEKITTPSVLGWDDGKAGSIFQVNDPPYGSGSNNVAHADEPNNLLKKLSLVREIGGINKSRWSDHNAYTINQFGGYGVAFHLFYHGTSYLSGDNSRGVWTFSTYNEPDLSGVDPAAAAAAIHTNHDGMKAVDGKNLLIEPALSDTEPNNGLVWLDNFYNSDGQNGAQVKTYFDVMDVHAYCKYADPFPTGLVAGAPEGLIRKVDNLRTLMASHGDGNKPIVFTELGWSTYTGGSVLRAIDRATQRNYLARAYMISLAKDIKSVWWYNFQDSGTTASQIEHNFGIVDWNGIPKPAYYGYYTMVKVLKDAYYTGAAANISNPYYGYNFWDENKNQYITSLWAANEASKTAVISTSDSSVTVVGIDGSHKKLPVSGGTVNVTINGAPVFIYSNAGVSVASIN